MLSEEPGSCWVVFVKPEGSWPGLKPVFVLPFVWRRGGDHWHLSATLRAEADRARAAVYAESNSELGEQQNWGLRPNFGGTQDVDLSGLDDVLAPPSGWAALAAGLIVAIDGGTPDRTVWASAAWKPNGGIDEVGSLLEKAEFAAARGATEFYVPTDQFHTVPSLPNLSIIGIRINTVKVRDALNDYTARLDAVPVAPVLTDDAVDTDATAVAFERCVQYHLRHPKSDQRRPDFERDFYWTHLDPTILRKCRRSVPDGGPMTHLVTIVSGNPEVTCLVAEALGPKNVLLLYVAVGFPRFDSFLKSAAAPSR